MEVLPLSCTRKGATLESPAHEPAAVPATPVRDVRRVVLLSLAGLVVVLGAVAAGAVVFFSRSSQSINVTVTAFTTRAPYVVTFRVDKPPTTTVLCNLYEIDFRDNPVGQVLGIKVGPSTQRAVQVKVTVPVTGTPVQPQVEECVRAPSSAAPSP